MTQEWWSNIKAIINILEVKFIIPKAQKFEWILSNKPITNRLYASGSDQVCLWDRLAAAHESVIVLVWLLLLSAVSAIEATWKVKTVVRQVLPPAYRWYDEARQVVAMTTAPGLHFNSGLLRIIVRTTGKTAASDFANKLTTICAVFDSQWMCTFGRSKMPTGSFFNSYLLALYGDCLISSQICSTLIGLLILAKRPRNDQHCHAK